jgi:hypothetical protein
MSPFAWDAILSDKVEIIFKILLVITMKVRTSVGLVAGIFLLNFI